MSTALVDPMASVRAYLAAEKSPTTRKAYASDFADFVAWCGRAAEQPLPASPAAVARYLAQLADRGLKASTIGRHAAAIRSVHRAAGLEPPTNSEGVKATLRGIRRSLGTKPNRKAPATAAALALMLEQLPDSFAGLRDRAILLIGFAAALRRSEIVDLKVNDLEFTPEGLFVTIRRSKTDQEGEGQTVAVPRGDRLKPVEAIEAWLAAVQLSDGPLFREVDRHGRLGAVALCDRSIARIVKRCAARAGFDAATFSGHSLRAGFVTSALESGADIFTTMNVTRHRYVETLRAYDRRAKAFKNHAGSKFL